MTKSVFGERYELLKRQLVTARKRAGLTQSQLAQRLSRPQSYVSKYERGERRLDVVELLDVAKALCIDPHEIISELDRDATR